MIELADLRTALAIADVGGIKRAADRAGVRHSTYSRQLRSLEDALGVALFERYSSGVRETTAGTAYLRKARRALDLLDVAAAEARQAGIGRDGDLAVGFLWPVSNGPAAMVLERFRRRHPQVRLRITESGLEALVACLRDRSLDLALLVLPPGPGLAVQPLWVEPLCLARPTALQVTSPPTWASLAAAPFLALASDEWAAFGRRVEAEGGPTLQVLVQDCSRESLLGLVALGVGLTVVPASVAQTPVAGVTFEVIDEPGARLDVYAAWLDGSDSPTRYRMLSLLEAQAKTMRTAAPG